MNTEAGDEMVERFIMIGTIFGVIFLSLSVLTFLNALLILFGGKSLSNLPLQATLKVAIYALVIGVILLGLTLAITTRLLR